MDMKDRESNAVSAAAVDGTDTETLQDLVQGQAASGSTVYTDDHAEYCGLPNQRSVKHSVRDYGTGAA